MALSFLSCLLSFSFTPAAQSVTTDVNSDKSGVGKILILVYSLPFQRNLGLSLSLQSLLFLEDFWKFLIGHAGRHPQMFLEFFKSLDPVKRFKLATSDS
jgi:hypothetical protein